MKLFVSVPENSDVKKTFLTEDAKRYLEERCEVIYSPLDRQLSSEEISLYAKDADVIMTGWGHVTLDMSALKDTSVKLIAHIGGSIGNLVKPDVFAQGIRVISGNNLYADSVAEGVLAYIFTALRKIPDYVNLCREGGWHFGGDYTEWLFDQCVGIIGMGAISKRVMKLMKPFGVSFKIYSGYPIDAGFLKENNACQASLEEIFSSCKIISLHSAMNERTKGMIGKEHFEQMQNGALFVNTARGKIVREEEMIECLKKKPIRAILDVYCQEPMELDNELRKLPNVYCIPHMAGPTIDRRAAVVKALADNIVKFEKREEMDLEISPEYAQRMTVVL